MNGIKRGGYRVPGASAPLNPNEKPVRANGWLLSSWTLPGTCFDPYISVGHTVLSICGGSGSLMEACMLTGRSCIMFELDGLHFLVHCVASESI